MTNTFDSSRKFKPYGIIDVDKGFFEWFNNKLNIQITGKDNIVKKIPVLFVAPERWLASRDEPIREAEGSLVLPIITLSRTNMSTGVGDETFGRTFADIKSDHVYYKQIDKKTSLLKELQTRAQQSGSVYDSNSPIYEVYTHRTPDHYVFDYEVRIWTSNIEEMNEIIQKLAQEYDYLSIKSFNFNLDSKIYLVAFQQENIEDDSNLNDYTGKERIIKKTFTFKVPANIMPESNQRKDQFKRYWTQSKLVIGQNIALSTEEYNKLIGK